MGNTKSSFENKSESNLPKIIQNIRSKNILKKILNNLSNRKVLQIIQCNKNIQKKFGFEIND